MAIRIGGRLRRQGGVLVFGLLLARSGAPRAQAIDAARAALPDATRSSGVPKVATSLQWPPFAFSDDSGAPDGIDIRLVKLLAGKLGLRPEFEDIKFPAIVPGVAAGAATSAWTRPATRRSAPVPSPFSTTSAQASACLCAKGRAGSTSTTSAAARWC